MEKKEQNPFVDQFAGGARQTACPSWEAVLSESAGDYGGKTWIPSIWFYGDNDQTFGVNTWREMFNHHTKAGGKAELVAFGKFISDTHKMSGMLENLPIWVPKVDAFLKSVGLPGTEIDSGYLPKSFPPPTNFATIDDVNAIPKATEKTKCFTGFF
jgi:hypothetical protein